MPKLAERFEGQVRNFLKGLGFKHVTGGRTTRFGGVQVDAGGGYGTTYVVVECHTSIEARRKSVRKKIIEVRGNQRRFREGLRKSEDLSRYKKLKLVLCTKSIEISETDRKFAEKTPQVYIWDDNFVDYYKKLQAKIGSYAVFSLLSDLDLRPTIDLDENQLRVPALRTSLRGRTLYTFWAHPEVLLRIGYVARREVGKEQYYQRLLKKDRLSRAASYIQDEANRTLFPNAILLNFREQPRFSLHSSSGGGPKVGYGTLRLPDRYQSAWVIDGQHRLYSFARAQGARRQLLLPVVAFHEVPEDEQAEFFLTINKEQRTVNPNLLWDLEGEVHPESPYGIIANAVKSLDSNGPMKGAISYPLLGVRARGRPLKLANLCDAIEGRRLDRVRSEHMTPRMKNPLFDEDPERRLSKLVKGLRAFFGAVSELFSEDWERGKGGFFCTNGGVAVMIRVFERILVLERKMPQTSRMSEFLSPLHLMFARRYRDAHSVDELRGSSASEGGRERLATEFCLAIGKKFPDLIKGIDIPKEWPVKFAEFEAAFSAYMVAHLGAEVGQWWENDVPEKTRVRVIGRIQHEDGIAPWEWLTLGEWKDLIFSKSFWPRRVPSSLKTRYRKKARFLARMEELVDYRNTVQHGDTLTDHQAEAADFFLTELTTVMAESPQQSPQSNV